MIDINFFKKSYDLKKKIVSNSLSKSNVDDITAELEYIRDKNPFIYNIETKHQMIPFPMCYLKP